MSGNDQIRMKCIEPGCPGFVTYEPQLVRTLKAQVKYSLQCDGPVQHWHYYVIPPNTPGTTNPTSANPTPANPAGAAIPKVDGQFWFDFSKELVDKGITSRDEAAASVEKWVLWVWGIYTAATSVGLVLAEKQFSFLNTFLIAIASAFLVAVYWVTAWVKTPILDGSNFDVQSPDQIRERYNNIIRVKDKRLRITLALSLVAAIMVSISLVLASVSEPRPKAVPVKPVAPSLSAALNQRNGETILSVNIVSANTKTVTVEVKSLSQKLKGKIVQIKPSVFLPAENGLVQASIPMDAKIKEAWISAEWEDASGIKTQLSRKISMEPAKK